MNLQILLLKTPPFVIGAALAANPSRINALLQKLRSVQAMALDKSNIIPRENLARTNEAEAKKEFQLSSVSF